MVKYEVGANVMHKKQLKTHARQKYSWICVLVWTLDKGKLSEPAPAYCFGSGEGEKILPAVVQCKSAGCGI